MKMMMIIGKKGKESQIAGIEKLHRTADSPLLFSYKRNNRHHGSLMMVLRESECMLPTPVQQVAQRKGNFCKCPWRNGHHRARDSPEEAGGQLGGHRVH